MVPLSYNIFCFTGEAVNEPFPMTDDLLRLFRRYEYEDGDCYVVEEEDAQSEASDYDDPGLLEESAQYGWEKNWEDLEMSNAKMKVSGLILDP